MIIGRPIGSENYTCSLTDKYYENQCKNPPTYYSMFEFHAVPDNYDFVPPINKYNKLEKVCYLFHHRLVQYYYNNGLDPDTPWWWYHDPTLHQLANDLAERIFKVRDSK